MFIYSLIDEVGREDGLKILKGSINKKVNEKKTITELYNKKVISENEKASLDAKEAT